jgi:hypothetical protein
MADEEPNPLIPRLEVTLGSAAEGDAVFRGTREEWLG